MPATLCRSRRLILITTAMVLAPLALLAAVPAGAATSPTTVSITFDDGQATQNLARDALRSAGLRATFYINSSLVGSSGYYLTRPQLDALVADGHEPGGHTLTHVDLTKQSSAEATRQVCDDRKVLESWYGPVITSFAYPYAASNSTAEQVVRSCGYASGRSVGSVQCAGCPYAEAIPPQNPYFLRTPEAAGSSSTLASLQAQVTDAENQGGGWVVLVFHGICTTDRCSSSNDVPLTTFTAFTDWLAQRSALGTVVRTVGQVMSGSGGATPPPAGSPVTSISCNSAACGSSWYKPPVQVALSASPAGSATYYTTDGSTPTTSSPRYLAPFSLTATGDNVVKYFSVAADGQAEQVRTTTVRVDGTGPAVSLTSPRDGATYSSQTTKILLSATASDAHTAVTRVDFYDGDTLLGSDTTAPYEATWNLRAKKAAPGRHTLHARATDTLGNVQNSAPSTITLG